MFESQTKPVRAEQFASFILLLENEDRRFELIDGEIVEKMPTQLHALIASSLNAALYFYFQNNPNTAPKSRIVYS